MQKKLPIIIAGLILLLILLGGGMFLMSKSSTTPNNQTNQNTPNSGNQDRGTSVSGTIKDLLSGGKTQTCSVIYPDDLGSGTVYTDGKKFGGDFIIKTPDGKQITGHMISDGTYMYNWSDGTKMGIKMNLAEAQKQITPTQSNPSGQDKSLDINQKLNFKCSAWSVDNSKFILPTDIEFTDLTSMMKGFTQPKVTETDTNSDSDNDSSAASPCDQIADATAKAACLEAFSGQ